jgi:hypothetical protein
LTAVTISREVIRAEKVVIVFFLGYSEDNNILSRIIGLLNLMGRNIIPYSSLSLSTFGLGGGIIDLLNEKYPHLIGQICEDSTTALRDAWGLVYPPDEDLWDLQVEPLSKLAHENAMLRYKLAKIECGGATQGSRDILQFGHELHVLEKVKFRQVFQ